MRRPLSTLVAACVGTAVALAGAPPATTAGAPEPGPRAEAPAGAPRASAPPCPAGSRAFTGAALDAPFFVLDGGSRGPGLGQFDSPWGLVLREEGHRTLLAVADRGNHRIKLMTSEGHFQDFWGGQGEERGRLLEPAGLAASPEGDIWVADSGNHRLQLFNALREEIGALTGQPLRTVGRRGSGPGEFEAPLAVAVDGAGAVYVADTGNDRIQKLDAEGRPLAAWGGRGGEPGRFLAPAGLAVGRDGALYVADTGNHRIQKLAASGRPVAQWGRRGGGAGEFESPRGLAVDGAGFLYVADSGNHRIQKLSPEGRAVAAVGCHGAAPGELAGPTAVAVDRDGFLYVVDGGNHRLQKLGPP